MAANTQNKSTNVFTALGRDIAEIGTTFVGGDWKTKLSYLILGFGPLARGQIVKGLGYLVPELLFIWYMTSFGGKYLSKFLTLGTVATQKVGRKTVYGDNSFMILLFGILTIIIIAAIILLWRMNIRENLKEETALKEGKELPTNRKFLASLLDENFDKTLLALPCLGIFVFTVLPIIFMICVAFTNYDANHQAPTNLFTWVGLENFRNLFSFGSTGFAGTFLTVLAWTLIWAFFATFIDYFLGLAVAMLVTLPAIRLLNAGRAPLLTAVSVVLNSVGLLLMGFLVRPDRVNPSSLFNPLLLCGVLLVGLGYILFLQTITVWSKQLYPEDARGQFEGIRILFFVLIPMVIAPLISNPIIKRSGEFVDENGFTAYLPTNTLFLVSGFLVLLTFIPLYFAARARRHS